MHSSRGVRSAGDHAGLGVTLLVVVVAAGDLVLYPLMAVHAATVVAVLAAGLAIWSAWRARPAGPRPRARLVPGTFAAFALVTLAWLPLALSRAPDVAEGRAEAAGVVTGLAVAVALVAGTRGLPRLLAAADRGWAAGLLLSVVVAAVELATGHHLWIPAGLSWAETSRTIVAGAFRNPNDFAVALVAMISGVLGAGAAGRSRGRTPRSPAAPAVRRGGARPTRGAPPHLIARLARFALVAAGAAGVVLTESRAGLLALAIVLGLHALAAVPALRHRSPRRPTPRLRPALAALAATAVAATFVVPALAARNPLARVFASLGQPGTAHSDALRVDLLRAAFRYFGDSDGLGTGAASFEPLLAADPHPGVAVRTWLHNTFVEVLLQYGVVVTAGLALVVATCLVTALLPGRDPVTRARTLAALVCFVALGCVAGSALTTPLWWLLLGQAVAGAWALSRPPAPVEAPAAAETPAGMLTP